MKHVNHKKDVGDAHLVCSQHAPKPDPSMKSVDASSLIGKLVKVGFSAIDWWGSRTKEHMWVEVRSSKRGLISGLVRNDPVLKGAPKFGQAVTFLKSRVEKVQ